MPIEISPLRPSDIEGAVTCIQRAFAQDPYNNWVFNASTFSRPRNRASLTLRCNWGLSHAVFHVAKDPSASDPDTVLGVACWLPPRKASKAPGWWDWYGEWWLWVQQGMVNFRFGRGGLDVKRYWIWKAKQAEAQREIWTDPEGYWFCNIVTVLPEAQGKGVGRFLFEAVTEQADREGRRCYLESSRAEPNMAIYEKMGFGLKREMVCDDGGEAIRLYCMVREPRGGEQGAVKVTGRA